MATKKEAMLISYNDRAKIVRERLARARRFVRFTPIPKSTKVLAAEKVIADYEDRNEKVVRLLSAYEA